MSILDQNYDPEKGEYNVRRPEIHGAFKPIASLDDVANPNACNTNNKPSTNGVLFAGYVICYYNDRTHTSDCLLEFVSTILSQTVDVAQYYKFAHLYNRARAIYEDKIISSASYVTDNFVEQDFKKLDDFINSIGSIFDGLVKSILELESD